MKGRGVFMIRASVERNDNPVLSPQLGAGVVASPVLAVASLDAEDSADGAFERRAEAVGGGAGADVAVRRGARDGVEVGPRLAAPCWIF